jgi:hexosaminidase
MRIFLLFIAAALLITSCTQEKKPLVELKIVPEPIKIDYIDGLNEWDKTVSINNLSGDSVIARHVSSFLTSRGFEITRDDEDRISLDLMKPDSTWWGDFYSILAKDDHVYIASTSIAGLYYGLQTLSQVIPAASNGSSEFREFSINDAPRFPYRGFHLDCGRHMLPVEFIKKYIDLMAHYKYNKFHWHLTEDQGWRIPINKYPKLAEVAAYRNETVIGYATTKTRAGRSYDGKRYGGFYSQDDIREVIQYAADRYVEVIPEIEMPGHAQAALAAYPELGCTGGPYETAKTWGIFDDVFCAGKEETFQFLEGVIEEVSTLFPSNYIHIGGDECPKAKWKTCPNCQKRMKSLGLKDEHELQSYFIQRMEKYVNSKGKKIIGWDEILEGGLAPNATVMSWRGTTGGEAAASSGHPVIMTPDEYVYLNYSQDTAKTEPLAINIYLPVEKVYSYEPIPAQFTAQQAGMILGSQVNVWTEYIHTPAEAEYMIFPRAIAMSEVLWSSKEKKNYQSFLARMENQWNYLDEHKVNYAKHIRK